MCQLREKASTQNKLFSKGHTKNRGKTKQPNQTCQCNGINQGILKQKGCKSALKQVQIYPKIRFALGQLGHTVIYSSLSVFRKDLIPCAYEIKCSGKFNMFSLFSGDSLVNKIGVLLV